MIEYLPGESGDRNGSSEVEFVGGPRNGQRAMLATHDESITDVGGIYRRGVACAEDGALRYVWVPAPPASAPS